MTTNQLLTMQEQTPPTATGEITNSCVCLLWNEETSDYETSDICYGECWNDQKYSFGLAVEHLLGEYEWFSVENLRLWHGNVSGEFRATDVSELLTGMTVNSEWIMRYAIFSDRIEYSLSHHDAPTGSSSVLRPFAEDDDQ